MSSTEDALVALVRVTPEHSLATDVPLVAEELRARLPNSPDTCDRLVAAVEFGVVSGLIDPEDSASLDTLRQRFAERLVERAGLRIASARWVVDAWMHALELTDVHPGADPAQSPSIPTSAEPLVDSTGNCRAQAGTSSPADPARRRVPRRLAIGTVAVLALVLLGGGVTAVAAAQHARAVVGAHGAAALQSASGPTPVRPSAVLVQGDRLVVSVSPFEIDLGESIARFARGARVAVGPDGAITLESGRAFVDAAHDGLTLGTPGGAVSLNIGRALISCTFARCSTTALDGQAEIRAGNHTARLAALQTASGTGVTVSALPDSVRVDPWFKENDALDRVDRRPGRLGLSGLTLLGSWDVTLKRPDLPATLTRRITVAPHCTSAGCTLRASTAMSDNVGRASIVGTVVPLGTGADRFTVDYGSHGARCAWMPDTPHRGGVDGSETVVDALSVTGPSSHERLTGSRTTMYSPTGSACSTSEYTQTKVASLSGVHSSSTAPAASTAFQQEELNYVADPGAGCESADAGPTAHRLSDVACSYQGSPNRVELAVYNSTASVEAAYRLATVGLGPPDTGDCTSACEGVAPNGFGRLAIARRGSSAILVTYDPRQAHLLVIAHGESPEDLSSWWSTQQRTHSEYSAAPLHRVGV